MFEIYLYKPDIPGDTTGVSLTLPATLYKMLDTLEKARITDTGVTYSVDFIACELDYKWQLKLPLRSFIAPDTNIHELNHLTHRLAGLDKGQLDCFEGMTMMMPSKPATAHSAGAAHQHDPQHGGLPCGLRGP